MSDEKQEKLPERIGNGRKASLADCIAEFENYAKDNPYPDRAHAYQHCADFLREHCADIAPAGDGERVAELEASLAHVLSCSGTPDDCEDCKEASGYVRNT